MVDREGEVTMHHAGARKRTYVTSFRCKRNRTGEKIRWAEELSGSYWIDALNAKEARKKVLRLTVEEHGIHEGNPGVWISESKRKALVQDLGPMGDDPGYCVKIGEEYLRQWAPRARKIKTTTSQDESRRFHSLEGAQEWAKKAGGRVVRLIPWWVSRLKRSGTWYVKTEDGKYVAFGGLGVSDSLEDTHEHASSFKDLDGARYWAKKEGFKRVVRVFRRLKGEGG